MNAEKSAIENATEDVMYELNLVIEQAWRSHGVPVGQAEFRRILAGYFERQTEREWRELLGVPEEQE